MFAYSSKMCSKMHCFSAFFIIVGFFGLILGLVYSLYVFPLLETRFYGETTLKNGTIAFQNFQNISFPMSVSIFLFNITNADEMKNGNKAKVEEIGPYVYKIKKLRIINNTEEDDEENLLNYYEKTYYSFDSSASKSRTEDDLITIIHIPYIVDKNMAKVLFDHMGSFDDSIENLLPEIFPDVKYPVLTATFKEIFFAGLSFNVSYLGDTKKSLNAFRFRVDDQKIHRILSYSIQDNVLNFSLMRHKNGSNNGPYKIHSGAKDPEIQGTYISYGTTNREGTVGYFRQSCSKLNGTNLFNFPPTHVPPKRMYTHFSDLCRSIFFQFEKASNMYGFPTKRYKINEELLDLTRPENKCFCSENAKTGCKKIVGLINLEECKRIPIIASYPHFYMAEPTLKSYVSGLNDLDNAGDLYSSYFDIEPNSATPIRQVFRFQINYQIEKLLMLELFFPGFTNFTEGIFPIYWTEENFSLTNRTLNFFVSTNNEVVQMGEMRYIVIFTSIGVMFLAVLIPLCQQIRSEYKEIKEREAYLLVQSTAYKSKQNKVQAKNQKDHSFPYYN